MRYYTAYALRCKRIELYLLSNHCYGYLQCAKKQWKSYIIYYHRTNKTSKLISHHIVCIVGIIISCIWWKRVAQHTIPVNCYFCIYINYLPEYLMNASSFVYVLVGNTGMQYGQNISLPYSHAQPPQPTDHNNMFQNDHKNNIIKTKMERDRDDGEWFFFFFFVGYPLPSPQPSLTREVFVFVYIYGVRVCVCRRST